MRACDSWVFFFYNLSFSKVNLPALKKTNAITKKKNQPIAKGWPFKLHVVSEGRSEPTSQRNKEAKLILKLRFKEKSVNNKAAREVDEQRSD